MKICVIGTGYVGLVTGACLSNLGNEVICVDKDRALISSLNKYLIPFYEPGLKEVVLKNFRSGRLSFTTNIREGVKNGEVIFIAVGTPPMESGQADISAVMEVAKQIAMNYVQNPTNSQCPRVYPEYPPYLEASDVVARNVENIGLAAIFVMLCVVGVVGNRK